MPGKRPVPNLAIRATSMRPALLVVAMASADEFAASMLPALNAIRAAGADTLEAMSCALDQHGIRSARGGRWYASSMAKLPVRATRRREQATSF